MLHPVIRLLKEFDMTLNPLNMDMSDSFCKYIPPHIKDWFNENSPGGVDWRCIYQIWIELDQNDEQLFKLFREIFKNATRTTYGDDYPLIN